MVKPLAFKGAKTNKKRKAETAEDNLQSQKKTRESLADIQEDDHWVTADAIGDINGPIVIVLPSTSLSCIACDAEGKVFVSKLENVVEVEPHDVRQVWIASRVAGTDSIGLKGHHGRYVKLMLDISSFGHVQFVGDRIRYLSCDKTGALSAQTEAMSYEETFGCIAIPDTPGTFNLQTQREKLVRLTDDCNNIRGDAESISCNTTVQIRMQARFKLRLKANKESKAKEKISRKDLDEAVGRKLDDNEVRTLRKARIQGDYHEKLLLLRSKGKHDKYA
ncbi:MAG: hypothetical protein LQ345_006746 [Seirophora villosa]|nr:MAG: hypothetical protein LQ345_006746 [Seirophora villosa]